MLKSKLLHILTLHLIVLKSSTCCDPLKNVEATLFGGGKRETKILKDPKEDAKDAYRIEISNANIEELCKGALDGLPELDHLIIKDSGITKILPGALDGAPNLRILHLTGNKISEIPEGVFNKMEHLRTLNLTRNSINVIHPDAFDRMPQLQSLEMSHNKIKQLQGDWFKGSNKVYRLVLDHNEITDIPKDALKGLSRADGRLHPVDLWLSGNKISDIHQWAFRDFDRFNTLWLSNNEISDLHDSTFANTQIDSLNLDFNKLTCLRDSFLANLNVKELNIDMNPLECDCLRKSRKWAAKHGTELTSIRRGLQCMRDKIDDAFLAQKKFYEEKLEMERRF